MLKIEEYKMMEEYPLFFFLLANIACDEGCTSS